MKPLSRRVYAITAILLAAVIFVALNIAADATLTTDRLDLTENGIYTLSRGTRHIIASLKEPITLKFFYSKKIASGYAQIDAYATQVRDLLEEYAALSHGKIRLEEVDPEPYTAAEDEANADGLSGAPTDSGDNVYFGLVGTNTVDGKQVIPFFAPDREPDLEYDVSSLVYRLSTPRKPIVGIISTLPLDTGEGGVEAALQGEARPFMAYEELAKTYTTKMLDPHFVSIPSDIDVLMIVDPGAMTPAQLYQIDQYVLRGGHALIFVDPDSELATSGQGPTGEPVAPTSSDLPALFRAWGVSYDPNKVVADRKLAQTVQVSADAGSPVEIYPIWLRLGPKNFDHKDQVTANLQTLNLATVGALSHAKGATTTFTPLIWSSRQASLLDARAVRLMTKPEDLMGEIRPTGKPYTIAARISGSAKTAFPAGPPLSAAAMRNAPPQLKVSRGPINLIVVADTDIFDDRFWVHVDNLFGRQIAAPFADNGAFILDAVENLTGSNDLISLRSRATDNRPFIVVQQLRAAAQAEFQNQADMLQQQLQDTENRLHALEQGAGEDDEGAQTAAAASVALTPAQQAEIERFKSKLIETRIALRNVQHNLRKDIDALGEVLAFINIALVPLLVAAFAIGLEILRRRRRARAIPL